MLRECAYTCHALLSITECTASLEVVGRRNTTISCAICASTWSLVYLVVGQTSQAYCTPVTLGARNNYILNESGRCSKEPWFRALRVKCITPQPMKLKGLRKCRTLVPSINKHYMYMYIHCLFMCIYVYILHKYKKLATSRVWANYEIL